MYDLIIIGAGPSGISAALYAKKANLNYLVIEKNTIASKLLELNVISNYLGQTSIKGLDLALVFAKQVEDEKINIEFDTVTSIKKDGEIFTINCLNQEYNAKSVYVCSGQGAKELSIPGSNKYNHRGLSYCLTCDGSLFKDKTITLLFNNVVLNKEINYAKNIAKDVVVLHNHASNASVSYDNVSFVEYDSLTELKGSNKLETIVINDFIEINTDALFPYLGLIPNTTFLPDTIKDEKGFIKVNDKFETEITGLYAGGDCIVKNLRQIVTAASDGAIAATNIISFLRS